MKLPYVAILLLLCGCSVPLGNKNGTSYHMILGFGIVSVNDNVNEAAVITRTTSIGVAVTDQPGLKCSIGYSSNKAITISEEADNVIVEVEHSPLGDISVNLKNIRREVSNETNKDSN